MSMTGHTKAETGRMTYRCSSHTRALYGPMCERCTQRAIKCADVDKIVWDYLLELTTGAGFEQALREAQRAELDAVEPQREQIAEIEDEIRLVEADAARLADKVSLLIDGGAVANALRAKIDAVDARHAGMRAERERLAALIERPTFTESRIADLVAFRADTLDGLKLATFEDKRAALDAFDVRLTATRQKLTISCALDNSKRTFDRCIPTNCSVSRSA